MKGNIDEIGELMGKAVPLAYTRRFHILQQSKDKAAAETKERLSLRPAVDVMKTTWHLSVSSAGLSHEWLKWLLSL